MKPKQTPKDKGIELFKSYEGCNVWVNFSAGVKEIINEALDIAISEAKKQGYEKGFKQGNEEGFRLGGTVGQDRGANQKAKEIMEYIEGKLYGEVALTRIEFREMEEHLKEEKK